MKQFNKINMEDDWGKLFRQKIYIEIINRWKREKETVCNFLIYGPQLICIRISMNIFALSHQTFTIQICFKSRISFILKCHKHEFWTGFYVNCIVLLSFGLLINLVCPIRYREIGRRTNKIGQTNSSSDQCQQMGRWRRRWC